jgi:hypothetical protein
VIVTVEAPVLNGLNLAMVEFNGTPYGNGTQLPPLHSGVNYSFEAVNILPGYAASHWEVTNGTIFQTAAGSATVSFGCATIPCPAVNLSLSLASLNHTLVSGEVYAYKTITAFAATFTVPQLSWWKSAKQPNPPPGATEVVDWGVGLGGVLEIPTFAVGLQMLLTHTPQGAFVPSYQAFWTTSIANYSGRTNFTANSQTLARPGDTISVSVNFSHPCTTEPTVYISDLTAGSGLWAYHATLANCFGPGFSAGTAEWMAWHPNGSTNSFSPSYTRGSFSKLTLNGGPVYPMFPFPCSPLGLCVPATPPAVSFSQWLNAGAGWNESLSGGSLQGILGPAFFIPRALALANVQIAILPFNLSNELHPLEVEINGTFYSNGATAHLANITTYLLSVLGSYQVTNNHIGFAEWGSTAGSLSNPQSPYSTLTIAQPGTLEALTVDVDDNWAGYVEATTFSERVSVGAQFAIPQTSYNITQNASGYKQVLGFWVGVGGYVGPLWQAGIQMAYSQAGVLTVRPWYEYVGPSGGPLVFGPAAYGMHAGDLLMMNVSACGPQKCGAWADNWSIIDLNQRPYQGQPSGTGPHENWSGTWAGSTVVDTNSTEWIAESPGATCASPKSATCVLPVLTTPADFADLWVNSVPVSLFGPFQLAQAVYFYPTSPSTGFVQFLLPSIEASQLATSFTIQE